MKRKQSNILWQVKVTWNSNFSATNKVILEHGSAHLFTFCLWLFSQHKGRVDVTEAVWLRKPEPPVPLQMKLADLCLKGPKLVVSAFFFAVFVILPHQCSTLLLHTRPQAPKSSFSGKFANSYLYLIDQNITQPSLDTRESGRPPSLPTQKWISEEPYKQKNRKYRMNIIFL